VLAAGARRAIGVDAQILVVDLDLDLVVDHRVDPDRRETGVTPGVGIERRDAHQAVDPAFRLQPAIGVGAVDPGGRRFDPRLLAAALFEPPTPPNSCIAKSFFAESAANLQQNCALKLQSPPVLRRPRFEYVMQKRQFCGRACVNFSETPAARND
jgi:hypothetical protein